MTARRAVELVTLLLVIGAADPIATEQSKETQVTVIVRTVPRLRARVYWGKKLLGLTPLTLQRPRDSGPMDIVLRANGYLPVRTRAHTFEDDKVIVKMTPEGERSSILGYRYLPPDGGEAETTPDAGVPFGPAPAPSDGGVNP